MPPFYGSKLNSLCCFLISFFIFFSLFSPLFSILPKNLCILKEELKCFESQALVYSVIETDILLAILFHSLQQAQMLLYEFNKHLSANQRRESIHCSIALSLSFFKTVIFLLFRIFQIYFCIHSYPVKPFLWNFVHFCSAHFKAIGWKCHSSITFYLFIYFCFCLRSG